MKTTNQFYNPKPIYFLMGLLFIGTLIFSACTPIDLNPNSRQLIKIYGDRVEGKVETAQKIIRTQDGEMLVAGKWQGVAFLMKLTSCGDSLWQQTYPVGNSSVFYDVLETSNGNFLAVGTCEQCSESGGERSVFIRETDNQGSPVGNAITLNEGGFNSRGRAIAQAPDGYVIVGSANRASISPYAGTSALVHKLDESLNVAWTKFYDASYFDDTRDIIALANGSYAFVGNAGAWAAIKPQIWYIDESGSLKWRKALFEAGAASNIANSLVEVSPEKLLICGTFTNGGQDADIFIASVSQDSGQVQHYVTYSTAQGDTGNELSLLDNGQILFAGRRGSPIRQNYSTSAWVMRMDADLNLKDEHFFDGYLFAEQAFSIVPLSPDGSSYAVAGDRRLWGGSHDMIVGVKQDACEQ